jgi:polyhydroxybutyrate depolymerase
MSLQTAFFAVAAALVASTAGAQTDPAPCNLPMAAGVSTQQLTSGQRPRTYRLFVPPGYDGRRRLPLVLDLHGSGGNAAGQARNSGLETVAAGESFLVATLDAENARWNVPVQPGRADDVAYASDVIDHVAARACTDQARVYATGFSGGGRMSSLLGCRLTDRLAAIAPVSALRFPAPCAGRPLPVLTFHGLADPQNTYEGHAPGRGAEWEESVPDALAGWAARNGCKGNVILEDPPGPLSTMRYDGCAAGAEVRLIRIDGLGHRWTREEIDTTAEMWRFFSRHQLR